MMEETKLIQNILQGADSFQLLVERYHVGLIIHCERLIGNRDDAEDIAQEAFIKAYFKLKAYDPSKSRFSTWLYRIATNVAIDHLRKNKHEINADDIEALAEITMPAFMEEVEKQEIQQAVISLMPPEYRSVIEAYYWQGKSYTEISNMLNVPLNTVRTWLRRAKQQLQEKLA